MKTYITLLRGINVGGHRKVPMAELRQLLSCYNFYDVKTYIQSGNVIFKTDLDSNEELQHIIEQLLHKKFGFEVSVIVKTPNELQNIFDACPFDKAEKEQSYFVVLNKIPNEELVKTASQKSYENDTYYIIKDCIYLYPKLGYGKSKFNLSFFEKTLQVSATARNYKTMLKLLAMGNQA